MNEARDWSTVTGVDCRRADFDLPASVAYLNTAYMGALPNVAVDAGVAAARRKARPWAIGVDDFFVPVERYRRLVASVLELDADGVAVVPSVSYGAALAARNLELTAGGEIVVLAEQFPSNVYAWRELAGRHGGRVVTVERSPVAQATDALVDAITAATAVVAIAPVHWSDGMTVDLVAVAAAARDVGAALVLDVTQAAGAMPLDLPVVRPDVVLGAGYKWLLGPYSLGSCWLAPHLRDGTPVEHNWITRAGSEDFAGLVAYRDEMRSGARRYDVGEVSNFGLLPAAIASLELISSWGVGSMAAHSRRLMDRLCAGAAELGFGVIDPAIRAPHLTGLRLPGRTDPAEVAATLAAAGVHVSVRGRAVRVSVAIYNDEQDVDRLLDVLATTAA